MIPKELLFENLACLGMVRSIYSFFFFNELNNSIKDLT